MTQLPDVFPCVPDDLRRFLDRSADVPSPSLIFRRDVMIRNLEAAVALAGGADRLCPHVKTHKCAEIIRLKHAAGIRRFKCATLAEAAMVAEVGADEIVIAYALFGPEVDRFAELVVRYPGVRWSSLVDAVAGVAALGEIGRDVGCWLDVDPGMGRTGIVVGQGAAEVVRAVQATSSLTLRGLHVYDGHRREEALDARTAAVASELAPVLAFRAELGIEGLPIVAGGTPSFPAWVAQGRADVWYSPGIFVLHDARDRLRHPDLPFEPAAVLLSRVVSRPGAGRVTLDLGYKALAPDAPLESRGAPVGLRATSVLQSEEHWVLATDAAEACPPGTRVLVVPDHVCPTIALHPFAHVIDDDGAVVDRWTIDARDR